MRNEDTICALATAPGGALGIIRVSGPESRYCLKSDFVPKGNINIENAKSHSLVFGNVMDGDEILDEVLVSVFIGPHSYTGEDSIEISCHGSVYIIRRIIEILISNGCRMAMPGEYTQRAFLNGRMDLCQAEAVADLIASSTAASARMAMNQMRGEFSKELSSLRDRLLDLTSLMELELDFSEEDVEFASREELLSQSNKVKDKIHMLCESFHTGNSMKNGIPVAIVGPTNSGKSTLLNLLVNDDRSIVSDIHGTTRDTIEDTAIINGTLFRFIDTAGIRTTSDTVENMGIERSFKAMDKAEIIIALRSPDNEKEGKSFLSFIKEKYTDKSIIEVVNKSDVLSNISCETDCNTYYISAKNRTGIDTLISKLCDLTTSKIPQETFIVSNVRHYEALKLAEDSIHRAIVSLENNVSGDLVSEDIRQCIFHLAEIIGGQITTDSVLQNIFTQFCIGK